MGYLLLILGLALWSGGHLFRRLAADRRAAMGDAGKGLVALAVLAGLVLMVIGYRNAAFVGLYYPPSFTIHINNLLMLLAFWFFVLSVVPGTLSARVRHKQLTAVKAWALGHLLVNGDLASLILFGGLLAWAVVSVILINRAQPTWQRPANAALKGDIAAFFIGAVALAVVAWVHTWLGYYPFG